MSILSNKISSTVSSLWKIRTLASTIWIASVGYGLSNYSTETSQALVPILIIAHIIPIWFLWIDSRYNRWYRRMSLRDLHIQKFINEDNYTLPSNQSPMKFNDLLANNEVSFPLYDLTGRFTFGSNGLYKWESSLIRSITDSIPLCIYGSQLLGSSIISIIFLTSILRYVFLPISLIILVIIITYRAYKKKLLLSKLA